MSCWAYVTGVIKVSSRGRTQPEIEYVLKTILDHLPKVTGSEGNMTVFINPCAGFNSASSADEFFQDSNLTAQGLETQSNYTLTLDGSLRDREFYRTFREYNNFMNRLAKRLYVRDCLVKLTCFEKKYLFANDNSRYSEMYEWENGWAEYLMWEYDRDECGNILCGKPGRPNDGTIDNR